MSKPPSERPRQLTNDETFKRMRQITDEEWAPIKRQLIALEEANAARMRARISGDNQ